MYTRRHFTERSLATVLGACLALRPGSSVASDGADGFAALAASFAKIEATSGGRLGVAVLDTKSAALVGYRLDERFPMCSTFKLIAAAAILARVDAGTERLDRRLRIAPEDILSYAPTTKQHVGKDLSVAELCEAAIVLSDNTAANLLLTRLGGPAALTRYARSLGDEATRLDRMEPDLNEATPGDPRDTTTPAAMARAVQAVAVGTALSPGSRDRLITWLIDCKTGGARLRAGLPSSWRVGDKTGSGSHGSSNDVAVIWPQDRAPLIIAAYLTETAGSDDQRNATHASVARSIAASLTR
ncbi:class A beta-lactamase [Rhodopseudomonas palustris]|uniref:Beta-lactamase n=1 Tax=Rhodopseudomonas palustris (strain BisB18) TaxID=316056 RepID=Q214B0_RHOPB